MPVWIFSRYDSDNRLLTPPFIVSRGADYPTALHNATTASCGIKLSKGDKFTETAKNWECCLGSDNTMLVNFP